MRLEELAAARVGYGYRRLHILLEREGWRVDHDQQFRFDASECIAPEEVGRIADYFREVLRKPSLR